jgi:hypothetical protein
MNPSNENRAEIVGVLHDGESLEEAIGALASAGWDRAELSLLGGQDLLGTGLGDQPAPARADDPAAPHGAAVVKDDVRQMRTLTAGIAGTVAAFLAAGATIMSGGATLVAIIGAAVSGGGAAALVEAVGKGVDLRREDHLREQVAQGGILLWATLREPSDEIKAKEILARCGATDVHVQHGAPAMRDRMMSAS